MDSIEIFLEIYRINMILFRGVYFYIGDSSDSDSELDIVLLGDIFIIRYIIFM